VPTASNARGIRLATRSETRAFVCVTMPEEELGRLDAFVGGLRGFSGFKWVKKEQFHITLKFLGDVTPGQITALDTNFSRLGGVRPFDVSLGGLGAFPSAARPKTLWLGVGEGADSLSRLASFVGRASEASGCERERRKFHPHLTLARTRAESGETALSDELAEKFSHIPPISWTCGSFTLMRSTLDPAGAIYTPIGRYAL